MRPTRLRIWAILNLLVIVIMGQTLVDAAASEQREFSAEDESVQRGVALPPGVIASLERDPFVKDIRDSEHVAAGKLPTSWFLASEVHLSTRGEKDLVVIGVGPLRGANVTTFWLFRPKNGGFESILNPSASAHNLNIKQTHSNGYRDIELLSETAVTVSTVVCKFDGSAYKPTASTLESIK